MSSAADLGWLQYDGVLFDLDGTPGSDRVRSFPASHQITLPDGDPAGAPGVDTACAMGNDA